MAPSLFVSRARTSGSPGRPLPRVRRCSCRTTSASPRVLHYSNSPAASASARRLAYIRRRPSNEGTGSRTGLTRSGLRLCNREPGRLAWLEDIHNRSRCRRSMNGRQQVLDCRHLGNKGGSSCAECFLADFRVNGSADNDDWRFRRDLFEVATNLETVARRNEEIHHDDVRLQCGHRLTQRGAVSNAADHVAGGRQQPPEGGQKVWVIIGQQHARPPASRQHMHTFRNADPTSGRQRRAEGCGNGQPTSTFAGKGCMENTTRERSSS